MVIPIKTALHPEEMYVVFDNGGDAVDVAIGRNGQPVHYVGYCSRADLAMAWLKHDLAAEDAR